MVLQFILLLLVKVERFECAIELPWFELPCWLNVVHVVIALHLLHLHPCSGRLAQLQQTYVCKLNSNISKKRETRTTLDNNY